MTQANPLHWPAGMARTPFHRRAASNFVTTIGSATDDILNEVRRMGGRSTVISSNLALRNDGLPYASQRQPEDPGVCVYFERKGQQLAFACDRWRKVEENMRAIAKTIEALRGIERWGSSDLLDQAFRGFEALPAPGAVAEPSWREVLDLRGSVTKAEIDAAYRIKAATAHPDKGGSTEQMTALNRARAEAKASIE